MLGCGKSPSSRAAFSPWSAASAAAETINGFSAPSVALVKELVNLAYETPLRDGVAVERRYFHALFGSHDQREGMEAYLAKRAPQFQHR